MREVQFFEYGDELNAILSDEDKNIVVINLKKGSAERVADYHLGALVNAFKIRTENDRMVYCCLNDGSIKIVNSVQL